MVMLRRQIKFKNESGSVTAELAMALPAVSLVIAITLSAFSLQIERMKLVDIAATAARAVARGESEEAVRALIREMTAPLPPEEIGLQFQVRENMSCVILARAFKVPGFGESLFELSELQCARKMGL
jgi:hypothetical protein